MDGLFMEPDQANPQGQSYRPQKFGMVRVHYAQIFQSPDFSLPLQRTPEGNERSSLFHLQDSCMKAGSTLDLSPD